MRPDLEELRRLHEAATPGPWSARRSRYHATPDDQQEIVIGDEVLSICRMTGTKGMRLEDVPDAHLIAAARNALPWLLDEIARLTAENAALTEGLRQIDVGQSIEPDHWRFRERAREIAARLTEPKETENG